MIKHLPTTAPDELPLCTNHMQLLQHHIKEFGIGHLCSQTEEQLAMRLEKLYDDAPLSECFDPLHFASWELSQNALDNDLTLLDRRECPVCALESPEWLVLAAEDAFAEAARLGLVGSS